MFQKTKKKFMKLKHKNKTKIIPNGPFSGMSSSIQCKK